MKIDDIINEMETMEFDDLKRIQKAANKAVEGFNDRKRNEALAAMDATAREHGFTMADLTGVAPKKSKKPVSPPKYQHPENPAVTWTGMGRQPGWIKDLLESGTQKDDLLIKQ